MEIQKSKIKIAILTPYLYENIFTAGFSPKQLQQQIEWYGHNPNNLHNTKTLETEKYQVDLENPIEHTTITPQECHFIISGCTKTSEAHIQSMKDTGTIVGRYSTFYNKPSGYTNIKPEDAGYAFDIPKEVNIVKILFTHDEFLKSILNRKEHQIRKAIAELNKNIETPILVTPYLSEALQTEPMWKTRRSPNEQCCMKI